MSGGGGGSSRSTRSERYERAVDDAIDILSRDIRDGLIAQLGPRANLDEYEKMGAAAAASGTINDLRATERASAEQSLRDLKADIDRMDMSPVAREIVMRATERELGMTRDAIKRGAARANQE